MGTMVITRGDLFPPLTATLTGTDAETGEVVPVDLTTASSITIVGVQNGVRIIERVVTGSAEGELSMSWQEGDTDTVGYIHFRFVVTWPNAAPQTFPNEGTERVRVSLDAPA